MTEKNGLNPSIPSATEVKPDKSFLRRYGTLLGFLLILGILYLWFLHPWFPVYETLPERPPAPPRQENAFYPFLDAASVISASTTDVRAVVSFTHDFAGGLVWSATIPEYIEGLQEANSEALRLYREGTERNRFYIPLEFLELSRKAVLSETPNRTPKGLQAFFIPGFDTPLQYGPEDFILETGPSTERKGEIFEVLFPAHLDLLLGQMKVETEGIASASPHLKRAFKTALLLEKDANILVAGTDLREVAVDTIAGDRHTLMDSENRRNILEMLVQIAGELPDLGYENLLAAQAPHLRNLRAGRFLRGRLQESMNHYFDFSLILRDRSIARLNLLTLTIASDLHTQEKGEPPSSLETLAPWFPKGLPRDPFTGSPLKMTVREGRTLFYSVGPDGLDQMADQAYDPTNGLRSPGDIFLNR